MRQAALLSIACKVVNGDWPLEATNTYMALQCLPQITMEELHVFVAWSGRAGLSSGTGATPALLSQSSSLAVPLAKDPASPWPAPPPPSSPPQSRSQMALPPAVPPVGSWLPTQSLDNNVNVNLNRATAGASGVAHAGEKHVQSSQELAGLNAPSAQRHTGAPTKMVLSKGALSKRKVSLFTTTIGLSLTKQAGSKQK
ncbi:hypothetical protein FRC07_002226 [Ceratobasidium sp. 392]|nr:hypothetical protein FRC07_002226 [Ceratobasidium sp. 392]